MVRRLATQTQGIAAVEFAMIAPVFILMVCGFMEYAHVSTARTTLEAATMRAARVVAASDCPSQRQTIMINTVKDVMSPIRSADGLGPVVTSRSYSESFRDVGEPEPFVDTNGNTAWNAGEPYTDVNGNGVYDTDMGKSGSIGGAGEVVSYTASFRVPSLFTFISATYNGSDNYLIQSSTVIRNEPIFRTSGCT